MRYRGSARYATVAFVAELSLADVQLVYDAALARLFHDLPSFITGVVVDVSLDRSVTPYRFIERASGSRHESAVPLTPDVELATVQLTDRLQDDVLDAFRKVWPHCPGHQHPMKPTAIDELASWTCPTTGTGVARIGAWQA